MAWELVLEAQDHAPADLSHRERWTLAVLAAAADDATRECPEGVDELPEIITRLNMGRSQRYAAFRSLCNKGALVHLRHAGNGRKSLYAIARMAPGVTLRAVDNSELRPGFPDATPVENLELCPGNPDATDELRPGFVSGFPGHNSRVGSGFPGHNSQNPDATRADQVSDTVSLNQKIEIRSTRARAHEHAYARTRETVRDATDGLTDDEIDETIRIVETRHNPRNITNYILSLIANGDLENYIPCGLGDGRHSDRCRNRDCAHCTASWCEGRCHQRRGSHVRPA